MNDKYEEMLRIVDNTIKCCSMLDENGMSNITRDIIISKCRKENVFMTRVLIASQILSAGFTVSTIAKFLKRTPQDIRRLLAKGCDLRRFSRAYRVAENESNILNQEYIKS